MPLVLKPRSIRRLHPNKGSPLGKDQGTIMGCQPLEVQEDINYYFDGGSASASVHVYFLTNVSNHDRLQELQHSQEYVCVFLVESIGGGEGRKGRGGGGGIPIPSVAISQLLPLLTRDDCAAQYYIILLFIFMYCIYLIYHINHLLLLKPEIIANKH